MPIRERKLRQDAEFDAIAGRRAGAPPFLRPAGRTIVEPVGPLPDAATGLAGDHGRRRRPVSSGRPRGVLGFTRSSVDIAALKKDFLRAAEEQNRRTTESFLREVRAEITGSRTDLTLQQQTELAAALDRVDSRMTGRLKRTEDRVREDAQKMAVDVYRTVSQQRAQDLNLINLRFDGIETKSALETRQTDAILDTLLQAAELRLK